MNTTYCLEVSMRYLNAFHEAANVVERACGRRWTEGRDAEVEKAMEVFSGYSAGDEEIAEKVGINFMATMRIVETELTEKIAEWRVREKHIAQTVGEFIEQ